MDLISSFVLCLVLCGAINVRIGHSLGDHQLSTRQTHKDGSESDQQGSPTLKHFLGPEGNPSYQHQLPGVRGQSSGSGRSATSQVRIGRTSSGKSATSQVRIGGGPTSGSNSTISSGSGPRGRTYKYPFGRERVQYVLENGTIIYGPDNRSWSNTTAPHQETVPGYPRRHSSNSSSNHRSDYRNQSVPISSNEHPRYDSGNAQEQELRRRQEELRRRHGGERQKQEEERRKLIEERRRQNEERRRLYYEQQQQRQNQQQVENSQHLRRNTTRSQPGPQDSRGPQLQPNQTAFGQPRAGSSEADNRQGAVISNTFNQQSSTAGHNHPGSSNASSQQQAPRAAPDSQYGQQPTRTQDNQYEQQQTRTQDNQYGQQPTRTQDNQYGQQPIKTQDNQYGQPPTRTQDNQYGQQQTRTQDNQYGQQPTRTQDNQYGQQPTRTQDNQYGQQQTRTQDNQYGQQPTRTQDNQYGQQPTRTQDNQYGQQPIRTQDNGQQPTRTQDNQYGQQPTNQYGQQPTSTQENGQPPTRTQDNGQPPTRTQDNQYGQPPTRTQDNQYGQTPRARYSASFTYDHLENASDCPETGIDLRINGLDCQQAIHQFGPYLCYSHEYTSKQCCEICAGRKQVSRAGCEYGDHAEQCSSITSSDCYDLRNRHSCCETCERLRRNNMPLGCEYGDMTNRCDNVRQNPGLCYVPDNQRLCCETCAQIRNPTNPGCPWGDYNANLCQLFDENTSNIRLNCYSPQRRKLCCQSCERLRQWMPQDVPPDCQYGDRPVIFTTSEFGRLNCSSLFSHFSTDECRTNQAVATNCCYTCHRFLNGRG